MNSVRIGVIGLGSFAHVARLPVLAELEDVEMSACLARTTETVNRVSRQFGFVQKFTELDDFIRNGNIDAAVVCTPKTTHYTIVMQLLEHGIHVFCEKPMATSLNHARAMVDCAERNSRVLMIGFNRRHAPAYTWAKEEFAVKAPDVCVAFKNRPGTEYRATMENAIHMVDLMRFYCGECIDVTAHANFEDPDYENSTAAILRFDSGAVGFLLGNRTCGQWMERLELYGGGKSVVVNAPDDITIVDQEQEHVRRMTPLRSGWATLAEKMGFRQEMRAFVDAVKSGTAPVANAADSIKTHLLLDTVLKKAGLPGMED